MTMLSARSESKSGAKPRSRAFRSLHALLPTLFLVACSGAGDSNDGVQKGVESSPASEAPPAVQAQPGKILFLQCAACHAVKAGAPTKVGPNLHCVIGRQAGSVADHKYSAAFQEAAALGLTWDRANLSSFIENPKAIISGNTMAFGGIADAAKRSEIIDYLASECDSDDG